MAVLERPVYRRPAPRLRAFGGRLGVETEPTTKPGTKPAVEPSKPAEKPARPEQPNPLKPPQPGYVPKPKARVVGGFGERLQTQLAKGKLLSAFCRSPLARKRAA